MTKEQEIYKNMRKRGRIYKFNGKYGINTAQLFGAIQEAGYADRNTVYQIIDKMEEKGYIRKSLMPNGKPKMGRYIIQKWVN